MSFPQSVALFKKHEMIVASFVIMAFCSFASLLDGTCGQSPENPNVAHFVDSKNSDRAVKAYLKLCNILTSVKSVNSERNRLLARAGKWKCGISIKRRRNSDILCHEILYWGYSSPMNASSLTVCPKHGDAYDIRWRTGKTKCFVSTEVVGQETTSKNL